MVQMLLQLDDRDRDNLALFVIEELGQFRNDEFLRLLPSDQLRYVDQLSAHLLPNLPMEILAHKPQFLLHKVLLEFLLVATEGFQLRYEADKSSSFDSDFDRLISVDHLVHSGFALLVDGLNV